MQNISWLVQIGVPSTTPCWRKVLGVLHRRQLGDHQRLQKGLDRFAIGEIDPLQSRAGSAIEQWEGRVKGSHQLVIGSEYTLRIIP